MEDSTWEGWTTPPAPTGFDLGYPEGRKLPSGPPGGWVGEMRTKPEATDDTIKYAARIWPQVRAKDFECDGRRYTERATGVRYELCRGNLLLADDPATADCFFHEDGSLWRQLGHRLLCG